MGPTTAVTHEQRRIGRNRFFKHSSTITPNDSISAGNSAWRRTSSACFRWATSSGLTRFAFESARQTLNDMAVRHGKLVSRMAAIKDRIAAVDINLLESYGSSDPVKYADKCRAINAEVYEICDKLGVVMPLSWNCRVAYAIAAVALANHQEEDGQIPDIELLRKSERLWLDVGREYPGNAMVDSNLAIVRRRLAEELADRAKIDEAKRWERQSLETVRGKPELLYELAIDYARRAQLTDKLATRSMPAQRDRADTGSKQRHRHAPSGSRRRL